MLCSFYPFYASTVTGTMLKKGVNEDLRKEYLELFDEVKYFDRDWVHTEMKNRQQRPR